ncbi:histidine phosphatase family protein [Galactobacter valiniphilus]|uniref:Histidine phosphatase family protein n=1 Tax=Galactobacter valiniphilus TaxID=2676122 RepID=A0A399J6J7_9MICC|nr:histidine phosphatase family protein [Galactobacter valiniphilus]RII41071.1 histidine phosphatase family protein [Galactobacter valiniphilus]
MPVSTDFSSPLAFVRHGQTDWNAAGRLQGQVDIPLNDTGREQAREAAVQFEGGGWDAVVASPLGRALETATIIAEHLGLPAPETDEGLIERGYGELEGAVDAELPAETRRVLHPGHDGDPGPIEAVGYRLGLLPGVEHSRETGERGLAAVRRIVAAHPGERVIVVAHGTIIRLTLDALDDWQRFHSSPRNAEIIELDAAQWTSASGVPRA